MNGKENKRKRFFLLIEIARSKFKFVLWFLNNDLNKKKSFKKLEKREEWNNKKY